MINQVMKEYNEQRQIKVSEKYKFEEIKVNMALEAHHPAKRSTKMLCADLQLSQKTVLNIKDLFVDWGVEYHMCRKTGMKKGDRIMAGITWGMYSVLPCGAPIL